MFVVLLLDFSCDCFAGNTVCCVLAIYARGDCVWFSFAAICEVHYPPNEPVKNSAVFVCGNCLKNAATHAE